MPRQAATGAQACRSSAQKRVRPGKDERGEHAGVLSADRSLIRTHSGYLAAEGAAQGFLRAIDAPISPSLTLVKRWALERIAQLWVGCGLLVKSLMQRRVLFFAGTMQCLLGIMGYIWTWSNGRPVGRT